MSRVCRITRCSLIFVMTSTISLAAIPTKYLRDQIVSEVVREHSSSAWKVSFRCSVAAETRRIFQALTTPEHIENWLSFPFCRSSCRNQASRLPNGFSVAHLCADELLFNAIAAVYSTCRTRKVAFSWSVEGKVVPDRTFVDIRLCGDFERSLLRLQHTGFRCEEDCRWHQALWSASLQRLCRFFDPMFGIMSDYSGGSNIR